MSVRKGSIAGIGSGPTSNKRASATDINNAEYAAAVAVMSEAKMAEACALLLSEKDYESEQQPGERDNDKLLKIFDESLAASKVVQKRVPAASMPMLHQQRSAGQPNAARTQAIPLKPKLKTMIPPRRGSSGPRPATKKGSTAQSSLPSFNVPPPQKNLHRETSDSSFASTGSVGSSRSAKRARHSPPLLDSQASAGGRAKAPPPAAMSFLAALNAQQGSEQQGKKQRQKPAQKKESPKKGRNSPPPPPSAGTRKQPPRSSRKG